MPWLTEDEARALMPLLIELQTACWSRSWTRLTAARAAIFQATGIRLTGKLEALLKAEDAK